MNQKLMFPVVTLLLGGSAGFLIGKGGKSDPASAEISAESLSRSSRAGSTTDASGAKGSASRPRSVDEIYQAPGQLQRMQSLLDYYSSLSPEQLEEEAKKLDGIPMPERIMASYVLFAKWAETDPQSAMAFSDKMGFTGMFVKPTIMQSWASVDPVAASKFYSENPSQFAMMGMFGGRGGGGPMGNGAASIIASEWAKQNPEDAMTWAKSLNGAEKGNALSSIVSQIAKTDPEKAMQLASTMEGDDQSRANRQIAEALGAKSWGEAEKFIAGLPADQQEDARRRAFDGLAGQDPFEAAKQLTTFADDEQRGRATATVAEQMSRENPQEAFNLVVSSGVTSDDAMRNVMMNYSRQDSKAALASIGQIPAGEMRDTAVGTYVFANNSTDNSQTFALAETITDEGDRERALMVSSAKWMAADPVAAKAAIQQSTSLSDEAKTRIIESEGNMRGWGGGGGRGRGR
jgi:hypothetical protein